MKLNTMDKAGRGENILSFSIMNRGTLKRKKEERNNYFRFSTDGDLKSAPTAAFACFQQTNTPPSYTHYYMYS